VSFRGAIHLYSTSAKWQRLNAVASLFEYEVDADDSYRATLSEMEVRTGERHLPSGIETTFT
jgi:hypothetical protein